jgi:tetratricopeptide (TPR) repeat protein
VEAAALQTLQAAAVIGRSFDLEAVQVTSGRSDEEIVSALEILADRGIITEVAEDAGAAPRYDFTHEKLRALVYAETSLARRRLLHGRAATALAERVRRRHEGDAPAGQIAQHYHLAGLEAEAAAYFVRAGDHARALYANTEALAHYRAALALGHPDTAALYEAIGDLQTLAGEYGKALESLETAAALTPAGSSALAGVEHKLAMLHGRCADWTAAESHFEAAVHGLSASDDRGALARVYADWSLAAHQQGQVGRAADLARVALEAAKSAADPVGLAQAHNILGILARNRGYLDEAVRHLALSLASAESLANPGIRSAALNNLALVRGAGGEHEQAIAMAMAGLALCQRVGDRHREAALHNNLADLLHAAGRPEEAMAHLKKAVVIFAEIGVAAGDAQPEIWKLTEW